jgi:hypothetical protein
VPEELLCLLDAFSHDGSSEDMLRILEVMPPDRTLRSYPNLPAALTAAPESVSLSAGWLVGSRGSG